LTTFTVLRTGAAVCALSAALALTACSSLNASTSPDQAILAACAVDKQVAADVEIDGSGSSSGDAVATERLAITADVVRRTAICSGHLLVRAFSASSGAIVTIYDGDLSLFGAIDNVRLR
jgi:hypothetical protein